MLAGPLGAQRAGAAQPVQERRGAHQRRGVGRHRLVQPADRRPAGRRAASTGEPADPARHDHPAAEPVAARRPASRSTRSLCQPNLAVATASPAASASRTASVEVAARRSSSACSTRTRRGRPGDHRGGDAFQGVAVGQRVRHAGRALDPLGQQHAIAGGQALEPLLQAPVLVEHPHVEVRYLLARRLDQVLDRLHDPGPDRPVRDREQAGADHVPRQRAAGRAR